MKKIIALFIVVAATHTTFSQCEDAFFPFFKGASFELTNYDGKGKLISKAVSTVTDISGTTATVTSAAGEGENSDDIDFSYEVLCEDDMIKIDFAGLMSSAAEQFGNGDVSIEGEFFSFPNAVEVGQELPDSKGEIKVKVTEPMEMEMVMKMNITERKVEKKESITTPAGTFDTYKVSQKTLMENNMMGRTMNIESSSTSWIAKKVGMVKSENYDPKGKLINYSILTKISQ